MKNYLIDSHTENERLNYQNKIDVYSLSKEMTYICPEKGQFFLDAGCGNGNVIEALLQYGVEKIDGVDLSADRVTQAKERFSSNPNIRFFQRSLDKTEFPENTYDRVITRYIFEHVTNAKEILIELHRVLKAGGKLSIINFDDIFFDFYSKNEKFNHDLKMLKSKLPQDFEIGKKLPHYLNECGYSNVEWTAEKFFFKDERLKMEIENSRMRLEQGREHLAKYFSSIDHYDLFAKTYLEEMKDPNNVIGWTKFMITAKKI
jgi:ubiquinone/menaquinone biosynthesis C-methylase UbiE